ncbi:hypothetical protein H1R20_g3624, partial [Candolleomyces eurysporus]
MQLQTHAVPEMAVEEELDAKDPLRHLMGVEDSLVAVRDSSSQLLAFLPAQSHSVEDGLLRLSFSCDRGGVPQPLNISLAVDASPGCGGIAWPAGQILATYLVQRDLGYLRDKNVLELGAGTGLVGLVAGELEADCRVVITDQAFVPSLRIIACTQLNTAFYRPLLPIMQKNVALNKLGSNVVVAELDWGSPIPTSIPKPDIILAADCVYFEPAFPLLVQTLADLADTSTEILFCYKKRRKADKRFFSMLKKRFSWKEVMDDPNREIYMKEAITLMRLFKRQK